MAIWAAAAAGVAWYLATVAGEVTYVTLADGRRQARQIPVVFKALLPFAPNFSRSSGARRSGARWRARTRSWCRAASRG